MKKKVSYKLDSIQMIMKLLNSITVTGAENAKYVAVIYEKLANEGEVVTEKEGEDNGGIDSL